MLFLNMTKEHNSYDGSNPSYYHNPGSEPLKQSTVGQLLNRAARHWPDRLAIVSVYQNKELTFKDVKEKSNALAAGFIELGLKPGDRLAILGVNSVQWYITMMAAAKAGLILVNINPAFVKDELEYCLKKARVKALVSNEKFKSQDYYKMLCSIDSSIEKTKKENHKLEQLLSFAHVILISETHFPGTHRFSDLMGSVTSPNILHEVEEQIQPDDPFNIQFSSGTTGLPKATLLSHFNVINNAYFSGKRLGFHEKHHKICLQVPFFHVYGCTIGIINALTFGATIVLPSPTFNAESTVETLSKVKLTAIYGTPTMYVDLCCKLKERFAAEQGFERHVEDFDFVLSGGSILAPELFKDIAETLKCTNISSIYGMTETSVMFQSKEEDTYSQRLTTVGCVAEHVEVKVVDQVGKVVPMGTPGELWFRSYATMLGYWDDEVRTQEIITRCRWIKSGDLFILQEDGYGKVVGRIKDVIIRGGENIFPAEIENFLLTHHDILDAQVYGVSDKRLGEEVCASVKLKSGREMSGKELKSYCKGKIAHFKIPKYVEFVEEYPKTGSGKVKKYVLREQMEKKILEVGFP